jgi:hypothetical protein
MRDVPTIYPSGEEKAVACIRILRKLNKLGALDQSKFAMVRNELDRFVDLKKHPVPEAVYPGESDTDDRFLITWKHIVSHLFPDLEKMGDTDFALWVEWDEAARRLADLLTVKTEQGEGTVDATQLPPPPSNLAELPDWTRQTRELLRGQEVCSISDSGIGYAVRENFLADLERLFPNNWHELYQRFQPDKFQTVRELVAMMAFVEMSLRVSDAENEAPDDSGPFGFAPPPRPPEWEFACRGAVYEIAGLEERNSLAWVTGLGYIEKLLQQPGRPISYADLIAVTAPERATEAAVQTVGESLELDEWSTQPALDKQALRDCNERLEAIKTELEDARQCNDSGRQERLEREQEEIFAEVRKVTGLGGVPRDLNSEEDNLRCRIAGALSRARKMLKEANLPKLAEHFRKNIYAESGQYIYKPEQPPPWSFTSL